jgi:hypothetical protein
MKTNAQRLKALAAYSLLKARARAVLGTAAASEVKLEALAKVAVLMASSTAERLSVAVHSSLLATTSVETGRFFTLINLDELVATLETHHFDISKLLANEIAAIDQALVSFTKTRSDAFIARDTQHAHVGKVKSDGVATSEAQTHVIGKARSDTAITVDHKDFDLSKPAADSFAVADRATTLTGKAAADAVLTADTFSRAVLFVREFSDSIDATDELAAIAVTDDGETMYLEKVVLDRSTTSEELLFALSATRSDAAAASDEATAYVEKPLDDGYVTSDYASTLIGKSLDDASETSDDRTTWFGSSQQDAFAASDETARVFYKAVHDTVTTHDVLSRYLELLREDAASIEDLVDVIRIAANGVPPQYEPQTATDDYAPELFKPFHDSVSVTDDFDGTTSTEDDQTVAFGKFKNETLFATEQRTASMQKPLAPEELAANDSGVLFWTNYCDSTYFSQGYVGQERTFT